MSDIGTVLAVTALVVLLVLGLALIIANPPPPPPPPSPEMVKLSKAMNDLARTLGEALVPVFERAAAVFASLLPLLEREEFDFLRPDPNPMPRIHLFKRSNRR